MQLGLNATARSSFFVRKELSQNAAQFHASVVAV